MSKRQHYFDSEVKKAMDEVDNQEEKQREIAHRSLFVNEKNEQQNKKGGRRHDE